MGRLDETTSGELARRTGSHRRPTNNLSEIEREANAFAMELLIPRKFLLADLEKFGGFDIEDSDAIVKLAKRCGVSVQIMTLRLGQVLSKAL